MSRSDIKHRQQRLPLLVMDFSASVFKRQQRQLLCCRSNLCVVCLKRRSACKAVLSEASVTRDKVPGLGGWRLLSERQYLASEKRQDMHIARCCHYLALSKDKARYCLTDSRSHTPNPGTVSRATNAALSTALQAGHSLRHLCAGMSV